MGDPSAKSTEIHVLILSDDEYIFWIASFEDKADANAAAKIANDGLREDSGHRFYVEAYPAYAKGSVPTLDQIKAANDHDCDEMWALTLEERLDAVDPAQVIKEIYARATGAFAGFARSLTEAQFNLLPSDRKVAIADWVDDPYADVLSVPPELKPDGALPVPPAPGQQELPIQ